MAKTTKTVPASVPVNVQSEIIRIAAHTLAERMWTSLGMDTPAGSETDTDNGDVVETTAGLETVHEPAQPKPRRTRKTAGRTRYHAVKRGKGGSEAGLTDRCKPAFDAIHANGKAGATIVDLEAATGRSTKQLENDLQWLRTNGFVASDND